MLTHMNTREVLIPSVQGTISNIGIAMSYNYSFVLIPSVQGTISNQLMQLLLHGHCSLNPFGTGNNFKLQYFDNGDQVYES